ncbi:SDR family NAD(P)-dependent oxidoreductase [Alkalihalobacterium chitinilyticum]|uniref:SDR family NAD(P)-dependent oxidoreductase n=1 Tax=Alkalihalobacterium chitinilyticum TaxID=2980103 RepID=A0ABT5VDM1_9BACI|nr:SDR family NAD(P)-dependent oxidoreductase [Alkalihalobacterium chitinilyticum]MDE5413355.1 SDR family NAD(P)-dependent oxidoreductase [Alkalihalobacterium chitinilyticum]
MNNEKIVLITGANSGIGKAAAFKFAKEGCTVIMACRNLEISKEVQSDIKQTTNNDQVDLIKLDVSSFDSIREFCREFKNRYEKLDVLIHNAAYANHGEKYRLSANQIELTFATNVIGPYLMTMLLVDHLKKSEDARILHASSNIVKHYFDPKKDLDVSNLRGERKDDKKFSVYTMYRDSKVALVLLTFKLAEVLQENGIKVNAIQINGAKMSKETLMKFEPGWRMIARIQNLFFPPPEKFAECYFEICMSDHFKTTTGKLINDKNQIMEPTVTKPNYKMQIKQFTGSDLYPAYLENRDNWDKVWNLCRELTQ